MLERIKSDVGKRFGEERKENYDGNEEIEERGVEGK